MIPNEQARVCLKDCTIGSSQLRAARGMLGWSRSELAKEAKLSAETIKNIEHGVYSPKEETIKTLVDAFSRKGIQFVQQNALVSFPTGCKDKEEAMVFSHVGIYRITITTSETKEETHD